MKNSPFDNICVSNSVFWHSYYSFAVFPRYSACNQFGLNFEGSRAPGMSSTMSRASRCLASSLIPFID